MEEDENIIDKEITDIELEQMLACWVTEDINVPDDLHFNVMQQLRTEQQTSFQQHGKVSFLHCFVHKKTWVSVIAAATLMICCLPILQDRQEDWKATEIHSVEPYVASQSRMIENRAVKETIIDEENLMETALFEEDNFVTSDDLHDGVGENTVLTSDKELSLEEQIADVETELEELEVQLMNMKDEVQQTILEERILVLQEALKQLKCTEENTALN